jgi:hypothetical protein
MNNDGLSAGYTKSDLIQAAFNEIGFGSYWFDIESTQLNNVLNQLDALMGSWAALGIDVGYPLPYNQNQSDINQETNLPLTARRAVVLNLAIEIAPSFGKTPLPGTIVNANRAYQALLLNITVIPDKLFPNTMLSGAGNKFFNRVFNTPNDISTPTEII